MCGLPGQSVINPSVETRLWRKGRSVTSATMTQISAATVLYRPWGCNVDSSLEKPAGMTLRESAEKVTKTYTVWDEGEDYMITLLL